MPLGACIKKTVDMLSSPGAYPIVCIQVWVYIYGSGFILHIHIHIHVHLSYIHTYLKQKKTRTNNHRVGDALPPHTNL